VRQTWGLRKSDAKASSLPFKKRHTVRYPLTVGTVEKSCMGRIAVSVLQPGMTLSRPVLNLRRQCLAEAGTTLDESKISVLQAWGIVEVEIEGVAEPSGEQIEDRLARSPLLQKLLAEIDERFLGGTSHEFIVELRRVVKKLALEEQGE
jgi:hypothetical protein